MTELRSKHAHEKSVNGTPRLRRLKKRGVAPVTEMQSKRVHDKGGCSEVESRIPRRSLGKVDNAPGKRERERGNKGKSGAEGGMVVEKEGEGTSDAIVRHRCALEAVCSLKSELEESQKSAIEGIVWSPVLKYKPFVTDRHLVCALVESWVPESKAFRIGPCKLEDVVKAAMDDRISRERARRWTGHADIRMYRNHVSVIIELCMQNHPGEVWFYKHTNLYAHAGEKCVPRITSWVNLYISCKYDAAQLISTIKDNQGIISIKECFRRTREALMLERVTYAATKKELEHMRALLLGRAWGDSLPKDAVGEEGDVHMTGEGSNLSIAKWIWTSPRRQTSAKQISWFVNPAAVPRTGKRRMRNIYTSRKQYKKATPTQAKKKRWKR
ncbi:hypothetical protein Cgig2_031573 [Carnegiea gigantea]|uniref:Uncharacterized protein n=1 Tax=Carnegiea gigantea TaxID=171969 RepID=A0A9Q1GUJ7_9CARY|nr:hypothetical protein Cgig2_031573 [Carnegiea gigantea]